MQEPFPDVFQQSTCRNEDKNAKESFEHPRCTGLVALTNQVANATPRSIRKTARVASATHQLRDAFNQTC